MKAMIVLGNATNLPLLAQIVLDTELTGADAAIFDQCLHLSQPFWVGYLDDKIACVWGLIPPTVLSDQAYLWLYTTDLIKGHQFMFVRHSMLMMEEMLKHYEVIVGHVALGAASSQRWLAWLGAKFSEAQGLKLSFEIRKQGWTPSL